MAGVEFLQVYKSYYEKKDVLKNLSFSIRDGEFISVVGPSGCGKSTLLRVIAGLESADYGQVMFDGRVMNDVAAKDRNISMVFQNYALFPSLNVFDNIAFTLTNRKVGKAIISKRVQDIAEKLGITHLLNRMPRGLSGGEAQRISIARALITEPAILLLDEPLANLDTVNKAEIKKLIRSIRSESKQTTIYVTHDPIEAMIMSDRIMILRKGEIEQFDTPIECYKNPSGLFVGSFIGDLPMNFLKITGYSGDQFRIGENGPFSFLDLFKEASAVERSDEELIIGIRSEDLSIAQDSAEERGFLKLRATVDSFESIGSRSFVYCKIGEEDLRIESNIILTEKEVIVSLKASEIKLFRKSDGKRVKEKIK